MHFDFDRTLFYTQSDPKIGSVGVLEGVGRDFLHTAQHCVRSRAIGYLQLGGHRKMQLYARKVLTESRKRLTEIDGVRPVKRGDNGAKIS